MKKKIKLLNYFLILLLILIPVKVNALSGSYSISSNSSVVKGNTISVTFNISASKLFYWQAYITYDTSKLELVSGSTNFQGESDNASNGQGSVSKTLKFKAKKTGTAWVAISPGDKDNNINTDSNEITFSKKTKNITVKEPTVVTYSSNNYLKSLSIDGYKLSTSFNKNTLEYKVELPVNTEKIKIKATTEDSNAEITGIGEKKVIDGVNTITIKVTAENGNEKKYVIIATVKELDPIEVLINDSKYTIIRKKALLPKPTITYTESTIKIGNDDVPSIECTQLNYTLIGLKDENGNINLYVYNKENETYLKYTELTFNKITIIPLDEKFNVPKGYNKSEETINETKITVYKNKKNSSYSIFKGINIETNKKGLYLYDSNENTIQRFDEANYNNSIISTTNNSLYVYTTFTLVGVLIITYICILINLIFKNRKPKKIQLEYKGKMK